MKIGNKLENQEDRKHYAGSVASGWSGLKLEIHDLDCYGKERLK